MLKLSLSLMLAAICALFLLGSLLDQLAGPVEPTKTSDQHLLPLLVQQLALEADQHSTDQLGHWVEQQSQIWHIPIQLENAANLALPAELQHQLHQAAGLPLAAADHQYVLKALNNHPDFLLRLAWPAQPDNHAADLWLTLSLYGGICLIMLCWLLPLMRRLWLLSRTTAQFGQGDLTARLTPSTWSYIPALEQSFNQMAGQITQLLADNQLLASSLSHDMRTPLACFRFGLEAALESAEPQQKDQYLRRLEQDLDRMEAMVNAFLDYASMSRQEQQLSFTRVKLTSCCQQVAEQCQPLLQQHQRQLKLSLPDHEIWLEQANQHYLQRALLNVLHNACRFANKIIELQLELRQGQIWICISDDGPGIAPADAERIFQPFVRLDHNLDQPTTAQFGLGLAIVQRIVSWHQGEVTVQTAACGGACFVLKLPLHLPQTAARTGRAL
jgi:signal transduction histidine kinase